MDKYKIKTPIWKTKSIGIAEQRLGGDLLVEIEYEQSNGDRLYPHTYIVRKDAIGKYQKQIIKGNNLVIIPISELEIYREKE